MLCEHWNGISFFYHDSVESSVALDFYTDAAPSVGFGGFHGNEWFSGAWPAEIVSLAPENYSTALHKLYPIVIACLLWGHLWCRKKITVFSDNEATVHIINKGRSSVPFINRLVRRLTWTSVLGNFILRATFIPGLENRSADALSFQFSGVPNAAPSRATGRVGMSAIPPDGARLGPGALHMYVVSAGEYMRKGIAPSTLKSYDRAWFQFSGFCAAFGVSPMPVNMSVLCAFIVHCFESRKLHPSSIKALVSGIPFYVRCSEPSACSLLGNPSIRLLMNGLRKQRPETKDKRLPITLPLLHTLVSNLRQGCFGPYVDTLLESVFFTAFYGFLRCGEFTTRCATFDPCRDLTMAVSTTAHFTKYTAIQCTAIQCTYICSALRR